MFTKKIMPVILSLCCVSTVFAGCPSSQRCCRKPLVRPQIWPYYAEYREKIIQMQEDAVKKAKAGGKALKQTKAVKKTKAKAKKVSSIEWKAKIIKQR